MKPPSTLDPPFPAPATASMESPLTAADLSAIRTDEVQPMGDRVYVMGALMLVMSLASMEMTVNSTAMPTIIGSLHGLEHYSWVASIYLLASTVTMPLYGRLADALGRKRVIIASISIFALASVLAASAQSMTQLIIFRAVQGLGAGGIMPLVLTILADIFTLKERANVQGLISAVWGIAAMGGPALGALLVHTLGWRSIFYINLPLGLIGMVVLIVKYHEHEKPHHTDLDLPGVLSLAVACTAALTIVTLAGLEGTAWWIILLLTIATVVAAAFFIVHERQTAHPILPARLMFNRMIGPSLAGGFLLGLGYLCVDTYVPLYIQGGRGGGAGAAAGVVTPVMLTWAICNVVAAPMIVRWGYRRVATVGATLIVLGFTGLVVCAFLNAPRLVLTVTLATTGLGFGPCSLAYLMASQEAASWQERGGVTSSVAFSRTMGGALGVGVMGALFNLLIRPELSELKKQGVPPGLVLNPEKHSQIPPDVLATAQHAMAHALAWVFVAMLVFAVIQFLVTRMLPAGKPLHAPDKAEAFEAV